jgi:tRNA U34 5-carboxymethylaminomethyl modifying enzyme MnmG/GidA
MDGSFRVLVAGGGVAGLEAAVARAAAAELIRGRVAEVDVYRRP